MEVLFGIFPFVAIFSFIAWMAIVPVKKWLALPTLSEYLAENPQAKSGRGISCAHCGSSSLRNWGVLNPNDRRRIIRCNQCDQALYRVKRT
jgi:hypothetical protein